MKNEDANGLRSRKEELTCRSYLENLVDALMMMIYVVLINLRRFSKFETQVTYKPITRFGIQVLVKDEDILCLGKHDQCREGKNRFGAT